MRELITGNQAVVCAALRAGCNYFAGYPITPANSILGGMLEAFSGGRGTAVQTEDEIAAIGQCIGAAMAGAKVMTASSGPGLSLYSENIGLAQMGEVPVVIVDCQRMGPATGGATSSGEGDVLFAGHVTSGGYPLPVYAATDAASAYRLTLIAFNTAEQLRTPVIVLLSKDIALTRQTVDLESIEVPPVVNRAAATDGTYTPYRVEPPWEVPRFSPIGGKHRVRFTGSIHDEQGLLTADRPTIERKLAHLREKIRSNESLLEDVELDADPGAKVLLISYGLVDGATREAVLRLRESEVLIAHLTLYSLWPVPRRAICGAVANSNISKVIVPELNIGLYVDEIRKLVPLLPVESVVRYDGGLLRPGMIAEAASEYSCTAEPSNS